MELPIYSDFSSKKQHFNQIIIDTEKEFDDFYETAKELNALFRGICEAKYKIFTSLQRNWIQKDLNKKFVFDIFFKRYLSQVRGTILPAYFKGLDIPMSFISIHSFLQHSHAPSCLIDFTPNVEVSLFFATEEMDKHIALGGIDDYFSIFSINQKDFELISDNGAIEGVAQMKAFWEEKGLPNPFEDFMDQYIEMQTEKVFHIKHSSENKPVYNALSSLNIVAQKGEFIYNGYADKPLEEALKDFFASAAQYQYSIHDDLVVPQSQEINRVYFEETLPKNKAFQERLKQNIINSYEINKQLAGYIKSKLELTKDKIYPDPETIGWNMFNAAAGL